jgi:triosephosphate isomerase (TIM)
MKKLLIIANWKSNKTQDEAREWFENLPQNLPENVTAVVCPSFIHLSVCKDKIVERKLNIKLGGQDVSSFQAGAHTGEVNAEQLREVTEFVIIGHSERRKAGETEEVLKQKVREADENGLKIIYCVSDLDQEIPEGIYAVAYEPLFAIGSGNPDTPENAQEIARKIVEKTKVEYVLYGGSVTSKNVKGFTTMENINGVLVGGASLNPIEFSNILNS